MKTASEIYERIVKENYFSQKSLIQGDLYFVDFSLTKTHLIIFNILFDERIRGKGLFTKLLSKLESFCKIRSMNIVIDNVINMRLKEFLLRRRYKLVGRNLKKSYYSIFFWIFDWLMKPKEKLDDSTILPI